MFFHKFRSSIHIILNDKYKFTSIIMHAFNCQNKFLKTHQSLEISTSISSYFLLKSNEKNNN